MSDLDKDDGEMPSVPPQTAYTFPSRRNAAFENARAALSPAAKPAPDIAADLAQLSINRQDRKIKRTYSTKSKLKSVMPTSSGAKIEQELSEHAHMHTELHTAETCFVCACANAEESLTLEGFAQFMSLIHSPEWYAKYGKTYEQMNLAIRKLAEEPDSDSKLKRAQTVKRCWIRLRLEEAWLDKGGPFNAKLLNSYFKNELSTPPNRAQFFANEEAFLSEDGLSALWVMFEDQEAWAVQYINMMTNRDPKSIEQKIKRYIRIQSWFHAWLPEDTAEMKMRDYFLAGDVSDAVGHLAKAAEIAQKESFLTQKGYEVFFLVLTSFGTKNAINYTKEFELRAETTGEELLHMDRLRGYTVRGLIEDHIHDRELRGRCKADIWTYFTEEHNRIFACDRAFELAQEERYLNDYGFDIFLKVLQQNRPMIIEYVKWVHADNRNMADRAWWIYQKIGKLADFDGTGDKIGLMHLCRLWTEEGWYMLILRDACSLLEGETKLLSNEGIELCQREFGRNPRLIKGYLVPKKEGKTSWSAILKTLQHHPDLYVDRPGGPDAKELFQCYSANLLKAHAKTQAPLLLQQDILLSDGGKAYFASIIHGPCTLQQASLNGRTTLAREYLRDVVEEKSNPSARILWFLQVLQGISDPETGEFRTIEQAAELFTRRAWQCIFVRNVVELAKEQLQDEVLLTPAGLQEFSKMIDGDYMVAYRYTNMLEETANEESPLGQAEDMRRWLIKQIGQHNADADGHYDEAAICARFVKVAYEHGPVAQFWRERREAAERQNDEEARMIQELQEVEDEQVSLDKLFVKLEDIKLEDDDDIKKEEELDAETEDIELEDDDGIKKEEEIDSEIEESDGEVEASAVKREESEVEADEEVDDENDEEFSQPDPDAVFEQDPNVWVKLIRLNK